MVDTWSTSDASKALANDVETEFCLKTKGEVVSLASAGVDVDVKAEWYDEWTPLHYAAYSSQKEVAELLIDKGADVNAKDKNGKTPLDWAVDSPYSDEETADLLRKHGGKTRRELEAEGK